MLSVLLPSLSHWLTADLAPAMLADLLSPVLLFAVPSGVRAWRAKHPKREA